MLVVRYDWRFSRITINFHIQFYVNGFKGSIDNHIVDLVEAINTSGNYFTTSSCSGRFLAFSQVYCNFFIKIFYDHSSNILRKNNFTKNELYVKKDCEWIKVTHDPLSDIEIDDLVIQMNK